MISLKERSSPYAGRGTLTDDLDGEGTIRTLARFGSIESLSTLLE
jgi:hypothetical protein